MKLARVVVLVAIATLGGFRPAVAIPIFAQRYHLQCEACHSVIPELNAFGNAFRDHGYKLVGVPEHGTTLVALREQISYTPNPASGSNAIVAASVGLAAAEVGAVEAYLHYNLGSQGGPGAPYLAYLANYSPHSKLLVRVGLIELPLVHSPAQRLDDVNSYGYEGLKVGLNDLLLTQPRVGLQLQYPLGKVNLYGTFATGEYQGAAYGGKPIDTGVTTHAERPELGLYARAPLASWLQVGVDAISGTRRIFPTGLPSFDDAYSRIGANVAAQVGRFDLLAEQWHGFDADADGFGGAIVSNGGYARLRYAPNPHAFVALRLDTQAAPLATRYLTPYVEWMVTKHARLLIEDRRTLGTNVSSFGTALTFGFPWPRGY